MSVNQKGVDADEMRDDNLKIKHLKAYGRNATALLLIHGWGASSEVWRECTDSFRQHFDVYLVDLPGHGFNADYSCSTLESFLTDLNYKLSKLLPDSFSVLGWSLGGIVASILAQRNPSKVKSLITVATNRNFVVTDDWLLAMTKDAFKQFSSQLVPSISDGEIKRILNRFCALQTMGPISAAQDLRRLKGIVAKLSPSIDGLEQGISWLSKVNLDHYWRLLDIPVLHQLGAYDPIVPSSVGAKIIDSYPKHQLKIFERSSHLPFFSEQEKWVENCIDFIAGKADIRNSEVVRIDKNAIAKSFSLAASSYDEIANFQHDISENLLESLPEISVLRMLDLGAGTGYTSAPLQQKYPNADIIEVDLAAGMLEVCRARKQSTRQVQADMECLPFAPESFELIYSNLSIQWCSDFNSLLRGVRDSLAEGGVFVFSTLVEGSLLELKQAWSQVDDEVRVNSFEAESSIKKICLASGLSLETWQLETREQHFDNLGSLLRSVKGIGAHNMNSNRPKGLLGKNKYRQFINAYNHFKTPQGEMPLSYRVLYAVLRKGTEKGN